MSMSWYNPLTWYKQVPEVSYERVNGQRMRLEIDAYSVGDDRPTFFPDSYTDYVKLQRRVFVVNNAVSKISKLLSQAHFTSENEKDRIVEKINNPNNSQSKEEFLKEFATFIKSAGWTVIWKRYTSYGNFDSLELINLDPDKIEFTDTGDSIEAEYEEENVKLLLDDVIIFYDSIKDKNGKGYSALKPLYSQISNIIDAQKAKGIQIINSGTTIVSPKVSNNSNVSDEGLNALVLPDIPGQVRQKDEIESKLNHRGMENRIIVASKGLDALNLSTEFNSFKFDEVVESDVLSIYDAFGVPVELTPYGKNATYDNKAIAELSLLQSEVMPLANSLISSLNAEFPERGEASVDFNHLECMSVVQKRIEETNTSRITQVTDMLSAGLIDIPQGQKMLEDIITKP